MLARPGTCGPSILHESTSKSAIRAPRHTPGSGIAARVDLEGSRGLESLPGALFFSRYMSLFSETCHFLPEKNRRRQTTCRTTGAGRRQDSKIRPCRKFWRVRRRECLKLAAARPLGAAARPLGAGRREAAGRPKSGVSKKCSRSLRGAPGASPESPGASGGALGAPKGPKKPPGGHGALGAPWAHVGPLGPYWALCGALWGPMWSLALFTGMWIIIPQWAPMSPQC